MAGECFRFDRFVLDPGDRRLLRDGEPVEINARYLDALLLLVGEAGRLVSKDRFLDEVWRGVPVTDEALTQCIRTLRQRLGDEAGRPRFIETVPKHGYRFVAAVDGSRPAAAAARPYWRDTLLLGVGGTVGGGFAATVGGLIYGFAAASLPGDQGAGAISVLLVILSLTVMIGVIGAAGVAFGSSFASHFAGRLGPWTVAGGALGGLVVGAIVKLLGIDAFSLLIGRSPGDITGPFEGLALGAAVGLGTWLTTALRRDWSLRRSAAAAALLGAAAGLLIAAAGGRLMGGSLALLAQHFPKSHLRLDDLGRLFGEASFGPLTSAITSLAEGGLFAAGVVGGMVFVGRRRGLSITEKRRIPVAGAGTSDA